MIHKYFKAAFHRKPLKIEDIYFYKPPTSCELAINKVHIKVTNVFSKEIVVCTYIFISKIFYDGMPQLKYYLIWSSININAFLDFRQV